MFMAENPIISSHKVLVKFDDEQRDRIAAALQALVDDMPSSQPQQPLSPELGEEYELLSVEELDILAEDVKHVKRCTPMVDNMEIVQKYLKTLEENDKIMADEKVMHMKTEEEFLAINNTETKSCANDATTPSNRTGYYIFQSTGTPDDGISVTSTAHDMNDANKLTNGNTIQGHASVIEGLEVFDPELKTKSNISSEFFTIKIAGSSKFDLSKRDVSGKSNNSNTCLDSSTDEKSDKSQRRFSYKMAPHGFFDKYTCFYCPVCGIDCGGPAEWNRHTETKHNFGVFETANMQTILNKNGTKTSYQCIDCKFTFSLKHRYNLLMKHRVTHLPYNYIGCRICKLNYKTKNGLYEHFKRVHPETVVLQKDSAILEHIRIFCHICKEQQNDESEWRLHLAQKHDYNTKIKLKYNKAGYNTFLCGICDERVGFSFIISHMLVHENVKSFACTLCKEFESSQLEPVIKHVRYKHFRSPSNKKVKCTSCNIIFGLYSERKSHYAEVHNIQLQRCNVCKKHFVGNAGLANHMKSHTLERR